MVIVGGLYFFSLYLAEGSPIFDFLQHYASVAFGQLGTTIFFWLSIIVGILVLIKGYLMSLLIRQFLLVLMIASAVLNFPIVDGESNQYTQYGWFLSRPILRILDQMFGGKAIAIKWFIIILLAVMIGRVLYTFNFSLPKLRINLQQDNKPASKKKTKAAAVEEEEEAEEEYEEETEEDEEAIEEQISKKIAAAKQTINKQAISKQSSGGQSLIKQLIKHNAEQRISEKEEKSRPNITFSGDKPTFWTSLMESSLGETTTIDETFLMEKAKGLQNKLLEFNVPITIEWFDIGPSIVQIRIKPEAGIKISTIENLQNDIALSLKSKSLRIVAPIPGTDCVGIQLPNPKPSMVRLGDVLSSMEFSEHMKKSQTNLSMGKTIDGSITIKSLEEMPHLLVAGATGSGKSVWVNDFILSLIYQNTPSELRFLMVDPKQVELEFYSGLPYLLAPIVTDPEKALKLLKRSVEEMERRYGILKDKRVKNMDEYNKKIIGDKMFRVVIVIDELADLMMSGNKKEAETCITRIAQKARAVGMHLILATQRPSVNVITGLIKANIPTRIAFGVVSEIDSRTILGRKGAEDLVGKGDMLYIDTASKRPMRIQAPFISTSETEKIVSALKNKYMHGLTEDDIYDPQLMKYLESNGSGSGNNFTGAGGSSDDDELVEQAMQVIAETRKASATLLQRKLNIWFARAARIMDILEQRGAIGPQEGARPRDIYI